jgi:Sulfotransferase family
MTASAEASSAVDAAHRRIPDFFIVGHPKSGTTALYEMLRVHPQIHMPVKEPWFFAPELRYRSRARAPAHQPDALDAYLALYAGARPEQLVGEATPSYLRSRSAAARIADLRPDARIIAILREPTSFLRSFHLQCVQSHIETEKDLGKALALEKVRRQGKRIPRACARPEALMYSEHVRYVEQLRRYFAVFPPEQVLVLIYEDYRRDNQATVRRVLQFLDVDDTSQLEVADANATIRVRSQRLDEMLHAVSVGTGPVSRAVKAGVKAITSAQLRGTALRTTQRRVVQGEPRPADERLMLELRRRFSREVVALSEYLDRDLLRLWGYEHVA